MTCREGAVIALLSLGLPLHATPKGKAGFDSTVAPFFKANCVKCHGPEKAKGKVALHDLDGDLGKGKALERWELMREHGPAVRHLFHGSTRLDAPLVHAGAPLQDRHLGIDDL